MLKDKIAIVTGGSKGMGLGIVRRFLSDGAKVVFCTNDKASIGVALEDLPAEQTENVAGVVANVAQPDDMQRLIDEAVAKFGGVDILANSAGIQRYGTVVDTSQDVWDDVFDVNVKGIFLASKYAIPEMEKRGGGSIINIASVQAYASQANVAAYTASKGAILSLTRAMALDHAPAGVRVNAICPASVDTPMLRDAAELWKGESTAKATMNAWGNAHPIGRVGRVEEIAALAAFLASDQCTFMTGADLKVDGGALAKLGIVLPD